MEAILRKRGISTALSAAAEADAERLFGEYAEIMREGLSRRDDGRYAYETKRGGTLSFFLTFEVQRVANAGRGVRCRA